MQCRAGLEWGQPSGQRPPETPAGPAPEPEPAACKLCVASYSPVWGEERGECGRKKRREEEEDE